MKIKSMNEAVVTLKLCHRTDISCSAVRGGGAAGLQSASSTWSRPTCVRTFPPSSSCSERERERGRASPPRASTERLSQTREEWRSGGGGGGGGGVGGLPVCFSLVLKQEEENSGRGATTTSSTTAAAAGGQIKRTERSRLPADTPHTPPHAPADWDSTAAAIRQSKPTKGERRI